MLINRSFLKLLILVCFMGIVLNDTGLTLLSSRSTHLEGDEVQLEREAVFIPTAKKQSTSFYLFKSLNAKGYINRHEEVFRSIVYTKNLDKVNSNNQKVDRTYNMKINKFADLTPLEFSETFTTLFKSNEKAKNYTKKLINQVKFHDLAKSQSIDETDFKCNHQDDLRNVRDHVMNHVNHRKTHVMRENQQFDLVEDIFASQNPNAQIRDARNLQLKNFFDSNQDLNQRKNIVPQIKIQLPKADGLYNSLQRKFNDVLLPPKKSNPLKLANDSSPSTSNSTAVASSTSGNFSSQVIDWTVHAGKIRYQGVCGACYTFATSDVVGSLYSIYQLGFFVALSTQQVVDCSTNGLTYGCNGGFLEGSYAYMQIKGIQTDANYPYTSAVSGQAGMCKKDGGNFKVTSFKNIEEGNCKALVNQLNYGPVSIGIAGYRLQFYSSGIFNDCNSYVDHAVVLIAYKSGVGWKIKNSWGPDWGMNGFAWIADGNNCGICNMAVSARI